MGALRGGERVSSELCKTGIIVDRYLSAKAR